MGRTWKKEEEEEKKGKDGKGVWLCVQGTECKGKRGILMDRYQVLCLESGKQIVGVRRRCLPRLEEWVGQEGCYIGEERALPGKDWLGEGRRCWGDGRMDGGEVVTLLTSRPHIVEGLSDSSFRLA